MLERDRKLLKGLGKKSDEEKKLDRIRKIGMKTTPPLFDAGLRQRRKGHAGNKHSGVS